MLLAVATIASVGGAAHASTILGDRNVRGATLAVDAHGLAVVGYTTSAGLQRHVLAWGAINALPHQTSPTDVQTAFKFDYSGGWKTHKNASFWKTVKNACSPYTGPALPFFVAGCDAPDGSYWALQSWQRNLPMRGFAPWTDAQKAVELHLSHWSGDLPVLEIYQHWTYGNAQQGFFGRLVYDGQPVFGSRSASATVNDPWARNIYIDTYNSDYGAGWKHDTAISTHPGNGGFCYTFVPQAPPAGYPSVRPNGNGLGDAVPCDRHGAGRNAYRAVGRAKSCPFRPGPELPGNPGVRPDSRGGRALRAGALITYDRAGFRAPRREGIEARPLPSPPAAHQGPCPAPQAGAAPLLSSAFRPERTCGSHRRATATRLGRRPSGSCAPRGSA